MISADTATPPAQERGLSSAEQLDRPGLRTELLTAPEKGSDRTLGSPGAAPERSTAGREPGPAVRGPRLLGADRARLGPGGGRAGARSSPCRRRRREGSAAAALSDTGAGRRRARPGLGGKEKGKQRPPALSLRRAGKGRAGRDPRATRVPLTQLAMEQRPRTPPMVPGGLGLLQDGRGSRGRCLPLPAPLPAALTARARHFRPGYGGLGGGGMRRIPAGLQTPPARRGSDTGNGQRPAARDSRELRLNAC